MTTQVHLAVLGEHYAPAADRVSQTTLERLESSYRVLTAAYWTSPLLAGATGGQSSTSTQRPSTLSEDPNQKEQSAAQPPLAGTLADEAGSAK